MCGSLSELCEALSELCDGLDELCGELSELCGGLDELCEGLSPTSDSLGAGNKRKGCLCQRYSPKKETGNIVNGEKTTSSINVDKA